MKSETRRFRPMGAMDILDEVVDIYKSNFALLLGVAALSVAGQSAILYYLTGYLFTVLAAFTVIGLVLRQLLDKSLIKISGRGTGLGHPLLYGTTEHFLEHFGLKNIEELPKPGELKPQ